MNPNRLAPLVLALWVCVLQPSCSTMIAPFNEQAYENAISLKVDSVLLMELAAEPFEDHRLEVRDLAARLEKAYEYAKGLPKNAETTGQWAILKDPERNLLGGFLKRWKEKSTLSSALIDGSRKQVAEAFDTIIDLEKAKIKQ